MVYVVFWHWAGLVGRWRGAGLHAYALHADGTGYAQGQRRAALFMFVTWTLYVAAWSAVRWLWFWVNRDLLWDAAGLVL